MHGWNVIFSCDACSDRSSFTIVDWTSTNSWLTFICRVAYFVIVFPFYSTITKITTEQLNNSNENDKCSKISLSPNKSNDKSRFNTCPLRATKTHIKIDISFDTFFFRLIFKWIFVLFTVCAKNYKNKYSYTDDSVWYFWLDISICMFANSKLLYFEASHRISYDVLFVGLFVSACMCVRFCFCYMSIFVSKHGISRSYM